MSSQVEDVSTLETDRIEGPDHSALTGPGGSLPPPPPGQTGNHGLPVFWAFVVLLATALVITGVKWSGRTLPVQIEIFSNIAMFAVAAKGFFALGQSSTLSTMRLSSTLGNLTVSALAFFMNINVFGHAIRWDHLPTDLWGWHTGWIICAGIQVLFLSGLAQYVLDRVLHLSNVTGNHVKKAASALVKAVKLSDKGVLLIFLTGAALWGVYFGSQISRRGAQAVFSDVEILWGSVLLLLVWTMVGILLYVAPAVYKKSKRILFEMDSQRLVIALGIAAAVVVAVLIFALLTLLGGVKIVLTVLAALAVLAVVICAAVKYGVEKILRPNGGVPNQIGPESDYPELGNLEPNNLNQDNSSQNSQTVCRKPNLKDVLVTILAYIVIPLTLVCVMAALSDEIRELIATGDYTWQQLLEAIKVFLQCAENGLQV